MSQKKMARAQHNRKRRIRVRVPEIHSLGTCDIHQSHMDRRRVSTRHFAVGPDNPNSHRGRNNRYAKKENSATENQVSLNTNPRVSICYNCCSSQHYWHALEKQNSLDF
jgi:hypothetical protein